jgi:hypothetical protein
VIEVLYRGIGNIYAQVSNAKLYGYFFGSILKQSKKKYANNMFTKVNLTISFGGFPLSC